MGVKIVDASAIAALLFGESEASEIELCLAGSHLAAPALLDFELANVCVTKARRAPENLPELLAALRLRHNLRITRMPVDHDEVASLAVTRRLTAYDASYLWLALTVSGELVTLDKKLAAAFQQDRQNAPPRRPH